MFGIGSTELLVILVVALIVLGPKSIPGIAKTLGKVMGEFRRVSTEFQRTMNAEVAQDEHEKRKKEAEEELFGTKVEATAPKAEAAAPKAETAAQPCTMHTQEPTSADVPAAPATPASTATVDTILGDATTGVPPLTPDSPLAQAVARAEAEARGEPLPSVESPAAQTAPEHSKSGEKA